MALRKFVVTERDLKIIETLAGYGLTIPQIAAVMEVSPRTLRLKQHDVAVNTALESGRAKAELRVGKALYERAIDGDIAAIRWWEMTRAKRSAEARVEHQVAAKIVTAQAPDWRALIGPHANEQADNG